MKIESQAAPSRLNQIGDLSVSLDWKMHRWREPPGEGMKRRSLNHRFTQSGLE